MDDASVRALEAAVSAQWAARVPGGRVRNLRPLDGGRSGVTLVADADGADSAETPTEVVVKAAPPGRPPTGRHDVLRQARVLEALRGVAGVAVPTVLLTGTDPVHHVVMSRAAGDCVEPVLDAADVHLPADLVARRANAAADMLAALHAVPAAPARPDGSPEPGTDLAEELDRWQRTAQAAEQDVLVGGEKLAALLAGHLPAAATAPVLVHGDFRLGNIVFDGVTPTGLIDWEIWSSGHPGVDLGWFLVFCDPDSFPGIGEPVEGMPSSADLAARYLAAGGRPIGDLAWFEAFGRFKMAAIMAHNLRRHREGRHVDPFQERLPPTIARLVAVGIDKLGG